MDRGFRLWLCSTVMRDDRALPKLHGDDEGVAASETTPVCSRVVPASEREGDLRINKAFFAEDHEPDTDVKVNVALLAASGERPVVRLAEPAAAPREPASPGVRLPRTRLVAVALGVLAAALVAVAVRSFFY